MAMSDRILTIRGLTFSYSGDDGGFSVSLPELDLEAGDFIGLVGRSGSGKSTLLDVLGLVREPTQIDRFDLDGNEGVQRLPRDDNKRNIGLLWADGDDAGLSRMRSLNLGYVLQNGGLIPYLSVGENIELPRRIAGLPVSKKETLAAMESLGLDWGYNKAVSSLSGGERQRVAILRAISHRPRLILADEPTAAVDSERALDVVSVLADMASSFGSAVLMVSHDTELTSGVASKLLRLRQQEMGPRGETRYSALPDSLSSAKSARAV